MRPSDTGAVCPCLGIRTKTVGVPGLCIPTAYAAASHEKYFRHQHLRLKWEDNLCWRLGGSPSTLGFVTMYHSAVLTPWRAPSDNTYAFGCILCRVWSEVPESTLGAELPCPNCGKPIKLNPFTIEADWRPVAKAWRGE